MKNIKIALTGGIGSGKSTALKILQDAGYKTISSDIIVGELYQKRKVKKLLRKLFPNAVTGFFSLKIDRQQISKIVFSDKVMHQKLTALITPLVLKEIIKRTKNLNEPVFVEVPLLFECGYQKEFDAVMVISRNKQDRINSVMLRSNLTEKEIVDRMNAQTDYDSFDLSPYAVIVNDDKLNALKEKVLSVAQNIIK